MDKSLHFQFYDAGAYDGQTEHYMMCSFYSIRDGFIRIGQSQLVKMSEWTAYRALIERNGWSRRTHMDYTGGYEG